MEWSTDEKTAFEVAAGAALAGSRALCTMKMSGLNVCYDSLIGIAYSGCKGGLVVYVADDPGVTAGMCEQDTEGFALMSDMPMLEPCSVAETYELTKFAFELSEQIGGPVFVRLVTNNSQSHACIEIEERILPPESQPLPVRDTAKFTKAGAAICMTQHRDLIARLAKRGGNHRTAGSEPQCVWAKRDGVGMISVGITNGYQNEALESLSEAGVDVSEISSLELIASIPFAKEKIETMISHCSTLLIAEELEGHIEKYVYMQAYKMGKQVKILGKEDGTYERIGEYDAQILRKGICKALDVCTAGMRRRS